MKTVITNLLLVTTLILVVGCNTATDSSDQQGPAPAFKYNNGENLRSAMQQFAYQLQLLDGALVNTQTSIEDQQQTVVKILRDIEDIGTKLLTEELRSSHPFMQINLSDLLIRVEYARKAAEQKPPSYYLAGQVSGGCTNCHTTNQLAESGGDATSFVVAAVLDTKPTTLTH